MRMLVIYLYGIVLMMLFWGHLLSYVFDDTKIGELFKRLGAALLWPVVVFHPKGANLLFTQGAKNV